MNAELIAALERAAELCSDEAERWGETVHNHLVVQCRNDAALIRAHITDLQNGGERAKVVALLDAMAEQHITRDMKHKTPQDEGAFEALARAAIRVKAGAHVSTGNAPA